MTTFDAFHRERRDAVPGAGLPAPKVLAALCAIGIGCWMALIGVVIALLA